MNTILNVFIIEPRKKKKQQTKIKKKSIKHKELELTPIIIYTLI